MLTLLSPHDKVGGSKVVSVPVLRADPAGEMGSFLRE